MATFFERKALNRIFAAVIPLRKLDSRPLEETLAVYLLRPEKPPRKPTTTQLALNTVHREAVAAFGGRVWREGLDGLLALFDQPMNAVRAALHALSAANLASEMLEIARGRVVVTHGPVGFAERPLLDVSGAATKRAAKLIPRVSEGHVTVEYPLYLALKDSLSGYRDLEASLPRVQRIQGLGKVSTVSLKPAGFTPERERELFDVDTELRARPRRITKALRK